MTIDVNNKIDVEFWLQYQYPTTIVSDRYNGTYSGAKWLAFPSKSVPREIFSDDAECMCFWENYKGIVGKGITPKSALLSLRAEMVSKLADIENTEKKYEL